MDAASAMWLIQAMKASEIGTWVGIAAAFIAVGGAWMSLTSKVSHLEEKIGEMAKEDADTLCLAVLTRQVVAIELERDQVQQRLGALATRYCRDPENPDWQNAAMTVELTAEEQRLAEARALEERRSFLRSLRQIDAQLGRKSSLVLDGEQ